MTLNSNHDRSQLLVIEIRAFGFGSLGLGLPLRGCVGLDPVSSQRSTLFSWRVRELMTYLEDSFQLRQPRSPRLQAVSQTALQGVPSYFHISSCSAVGLGVSSLLTLLHCLSLLGAREAESYRLREARTPREPRCYTGCFRAAHGT